MRRACIVAVLLLVPLASSAAPATFVAGRSLIAASSSPGNQYAAGFSVVTTAPVGGDLAAVGGSVVSAARVEGDALYLGGSISSRAPVAGDARMLGGSITAVGPIGGDFTALGFSVRASGRPLGSVFVAAADVTLTGGSGGPVTIYANNVSLAGKFEGDIHIFAAGRISLAASTSVSGVLVYEAPEPASIPESASIRGGVRYTNASYLPDAGTSRLLAILSIGVFLFVRILGTLILAGLLAGLFPRLAEAVVDRATKSKTSSILLTMLLGFGILVATPVLILLLTVTFVGIGLALLLLTLYVLLVFLALLYSGIALGNLFARRVYGRTNVLWHDGILGMLALSLLALIPFVGPLIVGLLGIFVTGALLQIFFFFAFPRD